MLPAASSSGRKSSKTELLHLGHLGSDSDNITYIKHLGHPTTTIDVDSGLLEYFKLSSDETHDLGGDISGDTVAACCPRLGGDKFSFSSSCCLSIVCLVLLLFLRMLMIFILINIQLSTEIQRRVACWDGNCVRMKGSLYREENQFGVDLNDVIKVWIGMGE